MGAKTQVVTIKGGSADYQIPFFKMNFENSEFHVEVYIAVLVCISYLMYMVVITEYDEFVASLPEDVLASSAPMYTFFTVQLLSKFTLWRFNITNLLIHIGDHPIIMA